MTKKSIFNYIKDLRQKDFIKNFFKYLLQGIFYTVPIVVTIFIIYKIFVWIDKILPPIPGIGRIPGLGFLIIIIGLSVIGYFGKTLLIQPVLTFFETLLKNTPVIKDIFGILKEFLSAFTGKKKKFDKPVLIIISKNPEIYRIGFVTRDDLSNLGLKNGNVAVYCPGTYTYLGETLIVPAENIIPLNIPAGDAMKFVVSGGVIDVNHEKTEETGNNTTGT